MTARANAERISLKNLELVKIVGREWVKRNICDIKITLTEPGSITHLLFGPNPIEQSFNNNFERCGIVLAQEMIMINPALQLLECDVQIIDKDDYEKDIDLIWVNHKERTIYVREAKGNIDLDSENIDCSRTFNKLREDLLPLIKERFPEYTMDIGILCWSVYYRDDLPKELSICQNKTSEKNIINVDHWYDFCRLVNFKWTKNDYHAYFLELGKMVYRR